VLRARAASLLALLVLAVISFAVLRNLRVTTSMTYFLPNPADQRAAGLLRGIAEGESARTIVCDVSGDAPDRLQETATKMMAARRTAPGIAGVRSGIDETTDGAKLAELFTTKSPTALLDPEDFDDERLAERLRKLRTRLASPLGPVVRQLAPRDPLGGTMDALEHAAGGNLTSNGGVLFTADRKHAFLFVVTKDSAWDAPAQKIHLARIQTEFERARGSTNERLETSAVARHSVAAEGQIKADIERVGLISTIGILALFVLLFGSLRMVGLGLVALGVGTALALVVTQLAFGEIHGLTLAFGTSLLGVGIDYAEHYFTH
jgi:predicted exporter